MLDTDTLKEIVALTLDKPVEELARKLDVDPLYVVSLRNQIKQDALFASEVTTTQPPRPVTPLPTADDLISRQSANSTIMTPEASQLIDARRKAFRDVPAKVKNCTHTIRKDK